MAPESASGAERPRRRDRPSRSRVGGPKNQVLDQSSRSLLAGEQVWELPIAAIRASKRSLRRQPSTINELADSLQTHGLLQPVVVRDAGAGEYELIAGHRRFAAAQQLGWQTISALKHSSSEDEAYLMSLAENLQRVDLSPREEADALAILVRERGWSTRQVAAAIKRSQAFVSKRLRVFEDPMLAPAVLSDQLPLSSAEELLAVPDRYRYDLLARAVEGHWEHAQVRAAIREQRFESNRAPSRRPGLSRRAHDLRQEVRDVRAEQLTVADRRELRLLLLELGMLARASPDGSRPPIFPPLPLRPSRRSRSHTPSGAPASA